METNPFAPASPEAHKDDKESKKTKRKKRTGFVAPIPLDTPEKTNENRQKPSALDEALANLAVKKQETAEEKPVEKEPEAEKATPSAEVTNQAETVAEAGKSAKTDEYEQLKEQEPGINEFSGGEVIIHLNGNQPVAERVVPLHAEQAETEEPSQPPEQEVTIQHADELPQASEQTAAEPQPPETSSAGGGEVPPTPPPENFSASFEQPERPENPPVGVPSPEPAQIYREYAQRQAETTAAVSAGEQTATKQDVEDAMYQATKAGQNRGVLTGLLVGGGYEHFKHKRREKRAGKRFKKQSQQVEQTRTDQHFFYAEQRKDQANNERQFAAIDKRFENLPKPEKLLPKSPERGKLETPEQLTIPADHRLETSAWHSIEVDSKTGKAVEKPTFEYGQEYHHERAQETAPKDHRNAAAGEVALVAAAMSQQADTTGNGSGSTASSGSTRSTSSVQASLKTARKTLQTTDDTRPLWPWVVALVVVIICLAVVIH